MIKVFLSQVASILILTICPWSGKVISFITHATCSMLSIFRRSRMATSSWSLPRRLCTDGICFVSHFQSVSLIVVQAAWTWVVVIDWYIDWTFFAILLGHIHSKFLCINAVVLGGREMSLVWYVSHLVFKLDGNGVHVFSRSQICATGNVWFTFAVKAVHTSVSSWFTSSFWLGWAFFFLPASW